VDDAVLAHFKCYLNLGLSWNPLPDPWFGRSRTPDPDRPGRSKRPG
jgi:hypothetical protein